MAMHVKSLELGQVQEGNGDLHNISLCLSSKG